MLICARIQRSFSLTLRWIKMCWNSHYFLEHFFSAARVSSLFFVRRCEKTASNASIFSPNSGLSLIERSDTMIFVWMRRHFGCALVTSKPSRAQSLTIALAQRNNKKWLIGNIKQYITSSMEINLSKCIYRTQRKNFWPERSLQIIYVLGSQERTIGEYEKEKNRWDTIREDKFLHFFHRFFMFRFSLALLFSIHRYYQLTRNCGKILSHETTYSSASLWLCFSFSVRLNFPRPAVFWYLYVFCNLSTFVLLY